MTTRADGSPEVQTTSEAKRESMGAAVAAPLRDVNLLRTKIPPVLLEALADPYQRPVPATCARLVALIQPLNAAMGDDLDEPDIENLSVQVRGKDAALGAVASVASDIIPFRGWVRKLTGAERHDTLVAAAITAGGVRRAYLKGLGEARGCPPPATPSHILTGATEVRTQEVKPRYPIR
ncbi:hypothetical protein M9M90_12075 [Phenylobacterium sp. LH3H17]|nr:hypothetical protein [Phenylobacterium sp. LH3H17]UTP41593.1 hypothetical protein M9M90_12075 [Phenylobacterium sp. LH3H17]